ncbi:hypothetical protein [Phyllobacterium zundukense]|uniref:Uncharacterized protein n=1 Tax=Phyllobacterium zundukense TaxID=1867719 RepID=A0ACD4CWZ2_9HYPH|nr:hypothetical protein [Phyllobacterium zundukense]UXN58132.1 hypothetical protein N8E88_04725 [Phyllobacterium zundukense]
MINNIEPTLDELLSEPIIRLVMMRDGIDIADVRAMMEQAKYRLNLGRLPASVRPAVHNPCLNTVN